MNKLTIYVIKDPATKKVFYVGCSKNLMKRRHDYFDEAKNNPRRRPVLDWFKTILLRGEKPIIESIEECEFYEWEDREDYWIMHFLEKNPKLCNVNRGGKKGACKINPNNKRISEETSKRLSISATERFSSYSFEQREYLWSIIKNHKFKDANEIDWRIKRGTYYQVTSGRTWNDVTGIPNPGKNGRKRGQTSKPLLINIIQIKELRELRASGIKPKDLAKKYKISINHVYNIISGHRGNTIN